MIHKRLMIVSGPQFFELETRQSRGQEIEFVLSDYTIIATEIDKIVWDRRPRNSRALLEGRIVRGQGEGQTFVGYFNAVGAGLFDPGEMAPACR